MNTGRLKWSQNSNEIRKEVKSGKGHDGFSLLRKKRLEYPENVIFGHLNINSLRDKFSSIPELIKGKVGIFLINETKLDESFPSNQFAMSGYEFIRRDKQIWGVKLLFKLLINCKLDHKDWESFRHLDSNYRKNNMQK